MGLVTAGDASMDMLSRLRTCHHQRVHTADVTSLRNTVGIGWSHGTVVNVALWPINFPCPALEL